QVQGAGAVAELVANEMAGRIRNSRGWHQWTAPAVEIRGDSAIALGVDGEALRFDPPLRFEIEPGALRVRLAEHAPGLSPAAIEAAAREQPLRRLLAVAAGRPLPVVAPGTS